MSRHDGAGGRGDTRQAHLVDEPTSVPLKEGQSVRIEPKQPWPSAYRGSTYSLVNATDFDGTVLKWEHRDLSIYAPAPANLEGKMAIVGKRHGSFRVTADGEVLTKVKAESYLHAEQAPVSEGWIPVYLGKLRGEFAFKDIAHNPHPSNDGIAVWQGLAFNHGERWTVDQHGTLRWRWRDFDFESAFEHPELVETYRRYRPSAGRLYITEFGHVWVNVRHNDVPSDTAGVVRDALQDWKRTAQQDGRSGTLRMVNRRLVATSPTDDPSEGFLPLYIGHLSEFDDGYVPRPIVDDQSYFGIVGRYETVWENAKLD